MSQTGCLVLSLLFLVVAVAFILFPHGLLSLNRTLNRTLTVLDDRIVKHRYLVSLVLFAVSYMVFKLSLLISLSKG